MFECFYTSFLLLWLAFGLMITFYSWGESGEAGVVLLSMVFTPHESTKSRKPDAQWRRVLEKSVKMV